MTSFDDLSAELKLDFIEQFDVEDDFDTLWALRQASRVLHELVAPMVFGAVVLKNNETSGRNFRAISRHDNPMPIAHLVKTVHFQAELSVPPSHVLRDAQDDPGPTPPTDSEFPEDLKAILENLGAFPSLEKLVVEFVDKEDQYDIYVYEESEGLDDIETEEQTHSWRSLMRKVWAAISRNHGTLRTLEIKPLMPKQVSVWTDEESGFRELLSGLESIKITAKGGDNGAGWCINTADGYLSFGESLGSLFFDHLQSVTRFEYVATDDGPPGLGSEGFRHYRLPLAAGQMPKLKELALECCFISTWLADFIRDHSSTLETVILTNCYSGADCGLAEGGKVWWNEFLDSIADSGMQRLRRFDVKHTEQQEDYGGQLLKYASLDDKYGMLFVKEEDDEFMYEERPNQVESDLAAWERLNKSLKID
jgi:hypothetical protein